MKLIAVILSLGALSWLSCHPWSKSNHTLSLDDHLATVSNLGALGTSVSFRPHNISMPHVIAPLALDSAYVGKNAFRAGAWFATDSVFSQSIGVGTAFAPLKKQWALAMELYQLQDLDHADALVRGARVQYAATLVTDERSRSAISAACIVTIRQSQLPRADSVLLGADQWVIAEQKLLGPGSNAPADFFQKRQQFGLSLGVFQSDFSPQFDFGLVLSNILGYSAWENKQQEVYLPAAHDSTSDADSSQMSEHTFVVGTAQSGRGWFVGAERVLHSGISYHTEHSGRGTKIQIPFEVTVYGLFDPHMQNHVAYRAALMLTSRQNYGFQLSAYHGPELVYADRTYGEDRYRLAAGAFIGLGPMTLQAAVQSQGAWSVSLGFFR